MEEINLIYGDNMELMRSKPDNYYPIAIVDPQYGIGESSKNHKSRNTPVKQRNGSLLKAKDRTYINSNWDDKIPTQNYFDELFRVSQHQIIFGINYFVSKLNLNIGSGRIIWDKVNGQNDFSDAEIDYCSLHNSTRIFSFMWNGMMQGKSITEGRIQKGDKSKNQIRIHETEKPFELYEWLHLKYVKKGQRILDTHGGSKSQAIVAYNNGNSIDIIENNRSIFDKAKSRYNNHVLNCEEIKQFGYAKTEISKEYPSLF